MIRGRVVLFVVAQFIVCSEGKKIMKKAKDSMDDEVRLEYERSGLSERVSADGLYGWNRTLPHYFQILSR